MERAGFKTMIRGHDKIDHGFDVIFDGDPLLLNLFSAGGGDNDDLPPNASYRTVTPMALTIEHAPRSVLATPWAIEYQRFNDAACNGFRRPQRALPFVIA
jgi:hypothetical protein